MTHKINALETLQSLPTQVELDLLATLLETDDITYPWNPADEASEAYFLDLEEQFIIDDSLESEIAMGAETFYDKLDALWSGLTTDNEEENAPDEYMLANIQKTLQTAFAAKIPQNWLNAIAQKATEIFSGKQSIGQQLVECVQAVLPSWEEEDLLVLARPYAYAMRSSESQSLASVTNNLENRDWADLSEIELAKVSLAISYYALTQLNSLNCEN